MSDDDFSLDDEDGLSVEYSSDEHSEPDIQLENQYYSAKSLKEENPRDALSEFQKVLSIEQNSTGKSEWGFKALKQMIKIHFRFGQTEEMMQRYEELLSYTKQAVTRNYSEKSINAILDYVSTSKQIDLLRRVYTTTLKNLQDTRNDRLWFKTNTKLGKLFLEMRDFVELRKVVKELKQSCLTAEGHDDLKKGNQLLEIYALEIQMYTEQKDNKKLKTLYEQTLCIKCAVPHPLIMGIIRECGGKMHLREGDFDRAHNDFFESFKNYDEAGSHRRVHCLKYLVLASMLMKSDINPFDSQETKPYMKDPEIVAMTDLINAYQDNNIDRFEAILRSNHDSIMEDPFIREHIEELLRNVRTEVLLKLIRPYTRIHIPHIVKELKIDSAEVDRLLVSCILDGVIAGKIDQANEVLVLTSESNDARYHSMGKMVEQLQTMMETIESKATHLT